MKIKEFNFDAEELIVKKILQAKHEIEGHRSKTEDLDLVERLRDYFFEWDRSNIGDGVFVEIGGKKLKMGLKRLPYTKLLEFTNRWYRPKEDELKPYYMENPLFYLSVRSGKGQEVDDALVRRLNQLGMPYQVNGTFHNTDSIDWLYKRKAIPEDWHGELMAGTSSPLGATDIPDDEKDKDILFCGASSIEHIINLTINGHVTVVDFNSDQIGVAKFYLDHPEALILRILYANLRQEWDSLTHQGVPPPCDDRHGEIAVIMARRYTEAKIDPTTDQNRMAAEFLKSLFEIFYEMKSYYKLFPFWKLNKENGLSKAASDRFFDDRYQDKCLEFWESKVHELGEILVNPTKRNEFFSGIEMIWRDNKAYREGIRVFLEELFEYYELTKNANVRVSFANPVDIMAYSESEGPRFDYIVLPDLGPSLRDYWILKRIVPQLKDGGKVILTDVIRPFGAITNHKKMRDEIGLVQVEEHRYAPRMHPAVIARNAMSQYLSDRQIPLKIEECLGGFKRRGNNPQGRDFYYGSWASAYCDVLATGVFESSFVRFVLVKRKTEPHYL